MIRKDGEGGYEIVIIRARCGVEFLQLIDREDIPWIKANRVVKRMRKDYKRHEHRL